MAYLVKRRDCLKGFLGFGGFVLLAGCAPKAAPLQPTSAPTQVPTDVPTAAPPTKASAGSIKLVRWDSNPTPTRTRYYEMQHEIYRQEYPEVEVEYVPVPIANYVQKLTAAVTAGTPPDVIDMWFNWMAQYVGMKALLSLEPYLPSWDRLEDFSPGHMRLSRAVDDTAYVLAGDIFLQATHYRKDLVETAGLDDPRELDKQGKWDWDAYTEVGRALNNPEKNFYGVSMRGGIGSDFTIFNMLISATGGKWFDDNGVCLLGSDEAKAALEWYSGLCTKAGICQPSAPSDGFQEFTGNFYNGICGMMIHNDDGILGLQRLGRDRYANAHMPSSPAGMYVGMVGYGYAAMSATKYPEEAAQLVFSGIANWIEASKRADQEAGEKTEIITVAPMLSDQQDPILKDPLYEVFYDVINERPEYSFVNPYWLPDYAGLTAQMVTPDFQKILTGQKTPAEACDVWAQAFTKAQQEYLSAKK